MLADSLATWKNLLHARELEMSCMIGMITNAMEIDSVDRTVQNLFQDKLSLSKSPPHKKLKSKPPTTNGMLCY